MNANVLYVCGSIAGSFPFLAIAVIVAHYYLRRAAWRRRKRQGKPPGFYPSVSSMGDALQFLQVFYRPSVAYVLEAKRDEAAEEDDDGEPGTPKKQLLRQLRRIRRGERVERLVIRL